MSQSTTIQYKAPAAEVAASQRYKVRINGEPVFVYDSQGAGYAVLSAEGKVTVEIEDRDAAEAVVVRPLRHGIQPVRSGGVIRFEAEAPIKLSVEFDGHLREPLFIWINPLETEARPDPSDPSVRYFKGGEVHNPGEIVLSDGETVYIEEGAVVHGRISASDASNIAIRGRGILDGSLWRTAEAGSKKQLMMLLAGCLGVTIEGISVIDGPTWHVVPTGCTDVSITNVNILTYAGTGDGIDIVGCENVTVDNAFVRSKDDCIAIKAVDYFHPAGLHDVKNVRVTRSVFWNAEWGNALEIGYETRCASISEIEFSDCDVIRCEFEGYESGGTFTIHNGDRADVHNVLYNDIRVEDSQEKLIDIKVQYSQYSRDAERGQVRDIRFQDIAIVGGQLPVSIIRGYDGEHLIQQVEISNLTYMGEPLRTANEAKMVVELSKSKTIQFT
ncbi:glycosyl hydrolase family 28 protein [Paenibacillus silvisoli]|uniref:glycosyl hydrolase family 28 protein n=1 Tax=Paenibacillus silvisoli TaxID=3110539 RepID=UPI002805D6B3|nr:glycosyl hydrolase family 28 protein [Paenibacillus silvisoli]